MIEMMIRDDSISRERHPASSSLRRCIAILVAVALLTTIVSLPSSARSPNRARLGAPAGADAGAYGARAEARSSGAPGEPSRSLPRTHTIARGETVAGVLSNFDVARQDIARLVGSVTERWDVRKAQVGSQLELTLDPTTGAVQGLAIETDDDRRVEVSRAADGYVSRVVSIDSSSMPQPVAAPEESEAGDGPAESVEPALAPAESRPANVVRAETFRRGDNLDKVLTRLGLSADQRARVASRVVKQWNVRRADIGTRLTLTYETGTTLPVLLAIVESRPESPRIEVSLVDAPGAPAVNAMRAEQAEKSAPSRVADGASDGDAPLVGRAATLARGASIAGVLGQLGVSRSDVSRVVSSLDGKWNLRRAQVGTLIQLAVDPTTGEAARVTVRPPQGAKPIDVTLPSGIRIAGVAGDVLRAPPAPKVAVEASPATAVVTSTSIREDVLKRGETVGKLLDELGVASGDVAKVSAAIGRKWNLRTAKTGARVQLIVDSKTGRSSEIRITPVAGARPLVVKLAAAIDLAPLSKASAPPIVAAAAPQVTRRSDAAAKPATSPDNDDSQKVPQLTVVSGQVLSSFYDSAVKAGLDPAAISELASIFAGEVDLKSDVERGDRFRVLLDAPKSGARRGRVLAAEIMTGREPHRAFLVSSSDGRPEYYNDQGRTARRPFLKSPLDVTKVNSAFSMGRYHPILGYDRPHLGVDLAAAPGTPIRSVGDGVVEYAGWRAGGDGRYLKIRHDATYATAFSHLSAIAPGIREGKKVKRGQVVGFTGSTGLSTGPHLHYAFLKNDQFVDPMRVNVTGGRVLTGRERREFDGLRAARLAAMGSAGGSGSSQVAMAGR